MAIAINLKHTKKLKVSKTTPKKAEFKIKRHQIHKTGLNTSKEKKLFKELFND